MGRGDAGQRQIRIPADPGAAALIRQTAKERGEASIVYTSSSVGRKGRAYWGTYAISKFAIEGMMEVLADELENTRVRVNTLNPGGTRTRMRASAFPAEDPQTLKTPADLMPSIST